MEAMKAVAKTPAPLLIPWRQTEIQFAIKCSCFPSCTMKLIIKKPHFKFSLVIEIVGCILIWIIYISIIIILYAFLLTFFAPNHFSRISKEFSILLFFFNVGFSLVRFRLALKNVNFFPSAYFPLPAFILVSCVGSNSYFYFNDKRINISILHYLIYILLNCSPFMFICGDQ